MDIKHLKLYIDDRVDEGVFRVHKDVFCDPQVFEMEMKYIFERTWNFLCLESQLAKPHDFVSAHIGRTPVMIARGMAVTRDGGNEVSDLLGFKPVQSLQAPLENFNEVGLHSTYREWLRLMEIGIAS